MATSPSTPQLRLRVFAGPNGSGKSTIIDEVKKFTTDDGQLLDVGFYINADNIVRQLNEGSFSFDEFNIRVSKNQVIDFALGSGLLSEKFTMLELSSCFSVHHNKLVLQDIAFVGRLGQVIARLLREQMLLEKRRFSFETVFSHESNLDIMRQAKNSGYKVYLYYVATESAQINKYRVALRVKKGGHPVPEESIEARYYRSLSLLKEAADICYQAFFFDNSKEDKPYTLVGHFKEGTEGKTWDDVPPEDISRWFRKYYLDKEVV